jgi:molybdate transport system substrate-binding protein
MSEDKLISIIDDDELARDGIRELVESFGYKVVTFSSAEDFLASSLIAETTCLITDLQMPGLSGLELQEALRSQDHRTPVILITAYPSENLRKRAFNGGALGFLSKPFDEGSLIKCLTAAIKSRSSNGKASMASLSARTVFAAASLKNALGDVDAAFTKQTAVETVTSYDASSALMKQIEGGAPADAFVSADLKWMDYGVEKKVINESTRINLLGNVLVLIASKDSKTDHVDIKPGFDLAKLAGDGRIATGDVEAVPVGLYAKAALEKLGVWPSVEPKMAMTVNVRAALACVARGEAPLGIVYATDAKVEPGVKVVGVFPDNSHDPIIYPVAATVNAKPGTLQYLGFLRSATAKSIFEGYGFSALAKPTETRFA